MAATSTAFAAATGSAALASTTRGDASRLSSSNAFRTNSMVQFAPLTFKRTSGVVAARAALSEDSKSIGKEVLVSVLAASTALGFGLAVVDGAFANPIDVAKAKTSTTLKSAKDAAPSLPSAPSPEAVVGDAQKGAENFAGSVKGRIDGIFGKGKAGPLSKVSESVTSSSGGTGSAIGDAQKRVSEFGKNPIADNIEKASKNTGNNIASATTKPSGQRVDEATKKIGKFGSDVQSKGKDAVSEGKSFVNDQAQGSVPSLPNEFPKFDGSLPSPDFSKLEDLKSGVDTKVEDVKKAAEGAFK